MIARLGPVLSPHNPGVQIRDAADEDWTAIWPFLHQIVAGRDTYAYDPEMTEDQARSGYGVRWASR
jgi:hypothetical protein